MEKNRTKRQNAAEWEPWDRVAIFSSCPQPDIIENALDEAPEGVKLSIRFGKCYNNPFYMNFQKQGEAWRDEHGMNKAIKEIIQVIQTIRAGFSTELTIK